MRIRMFSTSDLILLLLFLFSVDLLDLSGALITLSVLLFFLIYIKIIKVDYNALLLTAFSATYFLSVFFYEGISFEGIVKYAVCPWACYVLAYNMMRCKREISVTKYSILMFTGFFLHGLLNLIASVSQYGVDLNNPFRLAYDFWQKRQISVTTASLYYSPMVLLAIGFLFVKNKKIKKIAALVIIAVGLLSTVLYQNRTLILAGIIVVLSGLIFVLLNPDVPRRTKNILIWCVGGGGTLILIVAWNIDFCGIRSFFEGTSFFARLSGEGQDRTKIWASFIFGDAWKYPFGGNKAVLYHNKPFVHNTWLDIYRRAGVIPFLTFVAFTVSSIRTTIRFASYSKSIRERNEDYQTLALALLGVTCIFFVEPVMEANPYIFYLPIFTIGAMNGRMFEDRKV